MLANRRATGFSATDNPTVTVDQLLEQLNVFIIDVHWTRAFTVYVQRISAGCSSFRFNLTTCGFSSHFRQLTDSLV